MLTISECNTGLGELSNFIISDLLRLLNDKGNDFWCTFKVKTFG